MSGLKVYLSLETKQFRRGLRQADRLVQKASKRIGRYGMMGAAALVGIGMKSVQMYGEQEAAVNALTSALATNGDNVTRLIPQYKAFAAEIQQQTVFGDEAILGMMAQIRNLGVMPDKLEEATKGAIGLSKALGMNAESAARYTALALKGEMTMLQRYIPALRQATTEAEKTALVHDMMAKGFKQAQAEAETTRGGFTQLKNAAGDMAEAIGGVIVETLTLNTQTGSLKDTVTEWSDTIQKRGPETAFMLQSGFIEVKTALFNTSFTGI